MAGDLPPGRWSALLVGAWWPARPDAPMAGVTYWRKAAQLKRNEANDLRNERSLLAVNQGRTADDLLERYWRGAPSSRSAVRLVSGDQRGDAAPVGRSSRGR